MQLDNSELKRATVVKVSTLSLSLTGLEQWFELTPSPSFINSFLQMCAMMPVAKASPITFTIVRNLSLKKWEKRHWRQFWANECETKISLCSAVISLDPSQTMKIKLSTAYNAQSTAMIRVMSSVGNPTDVSTITMVTSPACGIPAAPILAAVAVMLERLGRPV